MNSWESSHQLVGKIFPAWIKSLDQLQLPRPVPLLQLSFSLKCRFSRLVLLEPDQHLDSVFLLEAGHGADSMFPCATNEIISHTDVQRPVSSACRNVNPETHGLRLLGPRFRGDERMLVFSPESPALKSRRIRPRRRDRRRRTMHRGAASCWSCPALRSIATRSLGCCGWRESNHRPRGRDPATPPALPAWSAPRRAAPREGWRYADRRSPSPPRRPW